MELSHLLFIFRPNNFSKAYWFIKEFNVFALIKVVPLVEIYYAFKIVYEYNVKNMSYF